MNNSYFNLKNFIFINGTTIIFSSLFYILLYVQYDIKQIKNNGYCIDNFNSSFSNFNSYNTCCINKYSVIEICYIKTANIILELVNNYFKTFRFCWHNTLLIFSKMIIAYIDLLKYMIKDFLIYPTCLICCSTSVLLLYIIKLILYDLFHYKNTINTDILLN